MRDELIPGCHQQRQKACRDVVKHYLASKKFPADSESRALLQDKEWTAEHEDIDETLQSLQARYDRYFDVSINQKRDTDSGIYCSDLESVCSNQ